MNYECIKMAKLYLSSDEIETENFRSLWINFLGKFGY